jgi:type III secretory pathway lipoprotein EscJ
MASRLIVPTAWPLLGALGACTTPVAVDLDEPGASEALAVLERGGVAAEVSNRASGRVIEVGRSDAERALAALQKHSERRPSPSLLAALGPPSIVPSRLSEQARISAGLAGEVERTLAGLEGVRSARVHFVLPERSPLAGKPAAAPKATVHVLEEPHAGRVSQDSVRRMVAGAVSGLDPIAIDVLVTAAPGAHESEQPQLARVGPITTTRDGLFATRLFVGAAIAINLSLLCLLMFLWRRAHRRPSRAGEEPTV